MQESTNSAAETLASESGGESREPEQSQLEQVAALLRGEESGTDQGDQGGDDNESGDAGESQESEKPKTLNDLAEGLGIEAKDLFALEFNLGGDGESLTLGDLKDMAADKGQFEVDRLDFEETRTRKESDLLKAKSELSEIIALLPKNAIKPELIQLVADKQQQTLKRERGLTLSEIPEWNDDAREDSERGEMREHLNAYGYPPAYLDSITDHRTLKYIRDNMKRQQRIERVLSQVKTVKKPGHRPSGKPSDKPKTSGKGRRVPGNQAKVAKIAELLRTG